MKSCNIGLTARPTDMSHLPEDRTVQEEYLQVLAIQSRRVPIPLFLVACIVAGMAAKHYPTSLWLSWLVVVGIVLTFRWQFLSRLPDMTSIPIDKRVSLAAWLSLINGTTQALAVMFFPEFSSHERTITTLLLAGMMTAAVATTAGHLRTYLGFSVPISIAIALGWGVFPLEGLTQWVQFGIPALLLFFGLILIGLAKEYSKFFTESFEIRLMQRNMNRKLQQALDDAIAANEAKTRFLASASHDLRQPIHTLSLFTGALKRRQHNEETSGIIDHLDKAVDNLAAQMNSLLDMSKLDAGLVEPHPEILNLEDYLEQVHAEFLQETKARKLDLKLVGNTSAYTITDRELFDRIVRNLLSNALHNTPEGCICIVLSGDEENWNVTIRDTGRGIPESAQNLIFEEFYQLENANRDRTQGLGLGLSIVKRLADLLDIRITLASNEGKGTSFTLQMKRASTRVATPRPDQGSVSIAGTNILCIDDETEVLAAMERLLIDMGCKVRCAEGLDTAMTFAQQEAPDILIADLRLAKNENGLEVIRKIREITPGMPALLITGDTAPHRLKLTKRTGVPLLHKPVGPEVLARAIQDELNAKSEYDITGTG